MKISAMSGNKRNHGNLKLTPGGVEGVKFSQPFSTVLDHKEKDHAEGQLWEMVEKIKAAGNKLKSAATEENIKQYKDSIKDYLTFVLKNYHKLRHDRSINYSTVYTRVEIINKEAEELTRRLLTEEKGNIDVVAEVDRITGLIIDVYN